MSFEGRDILSTEDLTKEEILEIMGVTAKMEDLFRTQHVTDLLADKMVAVIFLEPSTRTRLSFETAIKRLGAKTITVADAKSSSAAKGETLADTARTIEGYVDCIVVRQPMLGGAKVMADAVSIPVINGGMELGSTRPRRCLTSIRFRMRRADWRGTRLPWWAI